MHCFFQSDDVEGALCFPYLCLLMAVIWYIIMPGPDFSKWIHIGTHFPPIRYHFDGLSRQMVGPDLELVESYKSGKLHASNRTAFTYSHCLTANGKSLSHYLLINRMYSIWFRLTVIFPLAPTMTSLTKMELSFSNNSYCSTLSKLSLENIKSLSENKAL